jgi:hypothetical protein
MLSLALAAVFFLGMLPRTACLCADGHRDALCPMMRHRAAAASISNVKAVKSCCHKRAANIVAPQIAIGAKAGSCCQRIVEGPPVAVVEKPTDCASGWLLVTAIEMSASYADVARHWPATERFNGCMLPPLDAVIVFSRLTI